VIDRDVLLDLSNAVNPIAFARTLGIRPDPFQRDVLTSKSSRIIMCCARQSGKSLTAALLALHTALYKDNQLILVLSPSLRQSGELFRSKIMELYKTLDDRGACPVKATSITALSLTLQNGSRIVSLPDSEGTIRGYSGVNLLIADEAARISQDLYLAVRPMLAVSKGRLVLLSTPAGKRGFFWSAYTEGGRVAPDTWEKYTVKAAECSRISAEFLQEERLALGARFYMQEYECSFEENEAAYFSYDEIHDAISGDVPPLFD
jgi:hypothetical protein